MRKRIVIDACIAQSSGESDHPVSSSCRSLLDAFLLETDHIAVFTEDLSKEWREHTSRYATKWLSAMISRRRCAKILTVFKEDLFAGISRHHNAPNKRAIKKDFHLLQAALDTDKRVISRDGKMRNLLKISALSVSEIRSLVWIDPTIQDNDCVEWIKNGANFQRSLSLGSNS